jgi:hypothetical protein
MTIYHPDVPPLPVAPADLLTSLVIPACEWCQTNAAIPNRVNARRLMIAIALQESACSVRQQTGVGPACSFWQFEINGIDGVMRHPASDVAAALACKVADMAFNDVWLHSAFADPSGDWIAAVFARLLIWTDRDPLPSTEEDGWSAYEKLWRPGKPRRNDWSRVWDDATATVGLTA